MPLLHATALSDTLSPGGASFAQANQRQQTKMNGIQSSKIMGHVENRVLRRGELATAPGSKKLIFKFSNLLYLRGKFPIQLCHYPHAFGLFGAQLVAASHRVIQCKQCVLHGVYVLFGFCPN